MIINRRQSFFMHSPTLAVLRVQGPNPAQLYWVHAGPKSARRAFANGTRRPLGARARPVPEANWLAKLCV